MIDRAGPTFLALWRDSWFFRANVVLAVAGTWYLLSR